MESRVLLIDDDQNILHAVGSYLRGSLGCEVHCASDREEAGALISSYEYSLAVTDLALTAHSLDGLDVINELVHLRNRPTILVLTGHASQDIEAVAKAKGADAVFAKPLPPSQLAAVARQLLSNCAQRAPKPGSLSGAPMDRLTGQENITTFIQPIVRLESTLPKLFAVEFLSRGPAGTPFERADALFAYARRKHAEHALDKQCASKALKAARYVPAPARLGINMHASSLGRDTGLADWLLEHAVEYGVDPSRITIEIVEHSPPWDVKAFLRNLAVLRSRGVAIALDDVGLGASNFRMMLDVKPECLKIDRSFVHGCHSDEHQRTIIRSVRDLAQQFGARVIAEGVEQRPDIISLQEAGINLMQGFFFAHPMQPDTFVDWLQQPYSLRAVRW